MELKKGFSKSPQVNPKSDLKQEQTALTSLREGNLEEAEKIYRELVISGSENHIVYGNLAAICGIKGMKEEMQKLINKALIIEPSYAEGHCNLGFILKEKGKIGDAIKSYKKAIKLRPNYPEALNNLANAFLDLGDLDSAIDCAQKALTFRPIYPEACNNLGIAFKKSGKLDNAINYYEKAIEINPNYLEAYNNMANALKEKGSIKEAIYFCNKAITIEPNHPEIYNNLGTIYQARMDLNKAIEYFKKSLEIKPNYPEAINNMGTALQEQGDIKGSIACYKEALQLKSDYPEVHVNLSAAQLLSGDYKAGWKNYDWRFISKECNILHVEPKIKQLDEDDLKEGDNLLVVSEQGLGDTLQYMRYIPFLIKQKINISFCAQSQLHELIKTSNIHSNPLNPEQAKDILIGKWIPLLSLPKLLNVSPQNPVVSKPYIQANEDAIIKWKNKLSNEKRKLVAINWQGNPSHEKGNSIGRSIQLELFKKISEYNFLSLISLQKGFGSEQLENCSFKDCFVDCQNEINKNFDFTDTAALISLCNLVITSDTSVAHLAGGLGKPTWLLIKDVPEWRWGIEGEKTFWYPNMRLFRQKERNNWEEVMDRVSTEIKDFFQIKMI